MPMITAEGKTFEVAEGSNLREALLEQDINLYSAGAKVFNCRGHGTCGTCFIGVEGPVSEPTKEETKRTIFHPHFAHRERRLACQVKVMGNVSITKFEGYFGDGEDSVWTPDQGPVELSSIPLP